MKNGEEAAIISICREHKSRETHAMAWCFQRIGGQNCANKIHKPGNCMRLLTDRRHPQFWKKNDETSIISLKNKITPAPRRPTTKILLQRFAGISTRTTSKTKSAGAWSSFLRRQLNMFKSQTNAKKKVEKRNTWQNLMLTWESCATVHHECASEEGRNARCDVMRALMLGEFQTHDYM